MQVSLRIEKEKGKGIGLSDETKPAELGACLDDPLRIQFTGICRVTYEEDALGEARFWATRTMEERVIAGWKLAEDDWMRGGADEPEKGTGFTVRRVSRSGR